MKPVELEIFLQDGLSPGLKKAGQTVARFSDESKKELKEITESLKLQKSYAKCGDLVAGVQRVACAAAGGVVLQHLARVRVLVPGKLGKVSLRPLGVAALGDLCRIFGCYLRVIMTGLP